jgi:SAM-dependent methyltransferase
VSHTGEELDDFARWEQRVWESRARAYAESITSLTAGAVDALLDAADVTAGSRVLDVATGPGVVALAARGRGARVAAVDQAEAMVGLARSASLPTCRAAAEALPYGDATFDAAVAGFLLNHLPRPEAAVAELARVCRGGLAFSVWDEPGANPALGLFGSVTESFGLPDVVPAGPDSQTFADEARMVALLAGARLVDVGVVRTRWAVTVDPGSWFDAVAAGTPRTGAVLAAAEDDVRDAVRARYVEVARRSYGGPGSLVTLPAAAVVGRGRTRP